jgi:hypothetical protein
MSQNNANKIINLPLLDKIQLLFDTLDNYCNDNYEGILFYDKINNYTGYGYESRPDFIKELFGKTFQGSNEKEANNSGYLRYKTGHSALIFIIYFYFMWNRIFLDSEEDIYLIISKLYFDSKFKYILNNEFNDDYSSMSNNSSIQSHNQQPVEKKDFLNMLKIILSLIDDSYSYGATSSWGIQSGKKGSAWTITKPENNTYPKKNDTLGILIYLVALFNVRYLTEQELNLYKIDLKKLIGECILKKIKPCKKISSGYTTNKNVAHFNNIMKPIYINKSKIIFDTYIDNPFGPASKEKRSIKNL